MASPSVSKGKNDLIRKGLLPLSMDHVYDIPGYSCAKMSPDLTMIASSSNDHIYVIDLQSGKKIATIDDAEDWANIFEWSPDGKIILTGDDDIKLWDTKTGKLIKRLSTMYPSTRNTWSRDGSIIASIERDFFRDKGVCNFLDVESGESIKTINDVSDIEWSPDGNLVAVQKRQLVDHKDRSEIQLWDCKGETMIQTIVFPFKGHLYMEWSPDSRSIALTTPNHKITIWDTVSGDVTRMHDRVGVDSISSPAYWSPDGRTIASFYDDCRTIYLWDTKSGKLLRQLDCKIGDLHSLAWTPDGSTLVSIHSDATVSVAWWHM